MEKNKRILIGAGVFILSLGIGLVIPSLFTGNKEEKPITGHLPEPVPKTITTTSSHIVDEGDVINSPAHVDSVHERDASILQEPQLKLVSLKRNGSTYTLIVKCENVPEDIVVLYKILGLDVVSETGEFRRVPGISSGKFTVTAFNSEDMSTIARKEISGFNLVDEHPMEKMSASDFQTLLLNQNDNSLLGGKNPKVAKYVALHCVGLNEGDFPANDIQHVREKIANGIWSTCIVNNVGYNERGQINSATIRPVYPKGQE